MDLEDVKNELATMRGLRHENLLQLYTSFAHEVKLYIVMELCAYGASTPSTMGAERSGGKGEMRERGATQKLKRGVFKKGSENRGLRQPAIFG